MELLRSEPFAGINPRLQNRIVGFLQKLRSKGMTLLIIDHEMRIIFDIRDAVLGVGREAYRKPQAARGRPRRSVRDRSTFLTTQIMETACSNCRRR